MAEYYEDGNYVVIKYGDTLWAIATKYKDKNPDFEGKTTLAICNQIGSINGLADINRIAVGTKLKLTKDGSTSSSSSNKLTITQFGLLADPTDHPDGKTLFATWTWDRDKTESYKVLWTYDVGNGLYIGQASNINVDEEAPETSKYSTYDIPDDAKYVKFKVKPIAKKKTENDKDVYEWEQDWSEEKTFNVKAEQHPGRPTTAPTVEIEEYRLIISLNGLDDEITSVDFRIYKDYGKNPMVTKTGVEVVNGRASYPHTVSAGSAYTVQYRVVRDGLASDWSGMSDAYTTMPDAPTEITTIRANDETSVYLAWTKVNAVNVIPNHKVTYDIQYTTESNNFEINASDDISEKSGIETTFCTVTGLESGKEYYFRVRATNDKGSSSWTETKSVVIGSKPEPPTTWSSTSTAITKEPVMLYWVHNSEDGSYQRSAKLKLFISNQLIVDENGDLYTLDKDYENSLIKYTALTEEELEDGKIHSCLLKTDQFTEGTEIKWQVQTAGILNEVYSDWSTLRTIDVYAQPTLDLQILKRDGRVDEEGNYILVEATPSLEYIKTSTTVSAVDGFELPNAFTTTGEQVYAYINPAADDIYYCIVGGAYYVVEPSVADGDMGVISEFPFYLKAVTGPRTQSPIGYHVSVTSNSIYETTDNIGNLKIVNAGEEIYSKYFDTFQSLMIEFNPGNIDLENNIEYTIACTASMDSGLSVTETTRIKVIWTDALYEPNAAIGIDRDTLTASIRPYCADYKLVYYQVEKTGTTYKRTGIDLGFVSGSAIKPSKKTTTGERVFEGTTIDGDDVYYCTVTEVTPVTDVFLSVYRREFDGSFTELATNLDGALSTTITDPHPSLDLARYRVVATSKSTGAVSYYDLPGHPIGETAVIIQWNEAWSRFETIEEDALEQPPWSGSLLRLPYNIDVSENVDPEVEMIEYIGRSNPVSYYGTQRRHTATWNVVIEKDDKETIYALRRLANWLGDVYVREPSGIGYWAHVVVSFSQTHLEKTIPVSLTITRVEGGM